MEIRNRETGAVTTISQFKASYPNTSFPKNITIDILDSYGYDPVLNGAAATVTAPYGVSVRDGVEQIDGQWFTKFVAGPVFTDNDQATAEEQETAYRAGIDSKAAESARTNRNKKLADSDWTQLADSSADATEWATYRAALRNLPSTDGFPHNITWPTEPS
jgi:hypothetical protein|tara:strand:- start:970 stop:1452 length:483 start_codon:yes stop_codon:yes gene_type:complete